MPVNSYLTRKIGDLSYSIRLGELDDSAVDCITSILHRNIYDDFIIISMKDFIYVLNNCENRKSKRALKTLLDYYLEIEIKRLKEDMKKYPSKKKDIKSQIRDMKKGKFDQPFYIEINRRG